MFLKNSSSRRLLVLLILWGLLSGGAGCNTYKIFPESVDVEKLMFARVLAIDCVPSDETNLIFRVTVGSRVNSGSANDPARKMEFFSSEGRTFFEAVRNFSNRVDREVFLGHLDYIILGKETAQLDPELFLDPLLRDQTIRSSTCMITCTDITAEDFLLKSGTEEAFPAERLDSMFLGGRLLSESSHTESIDSQHFFTLNNRIKTIDFLRDLNSLSKTALMPCLSTLPGADEKTTGSEDPGESEATEESADTKESKPSPPTHPASNEEDSNRLFALNGYAVYTDRLVGYLTGTQGRAANILLGRVYSGQLFIQTPDGHNISAEILGCDRQFIPRWEGDNLAVDVNITLTTSIAELQGSTAAQPEELVTHLTQQQNSMITQELEELIRYTQENKCDIAGIGKLFARSYPVRFRKAIGDTWTNDMYPQVAFHVNVHSIVEHSRNLLAPIIEHE